MIFVLTPNTKDRTKDQELAKRLCLRFSYGEYAVSPVLTFSYLEDKDDWYVERYYRELLGRCEQMRVVCDEVTEQMISLIRIAIEKSVKIEFYDGDGNYINYDALIINKRIGPGYRQMIHLAHGDIPASGFCPHCGNPLTKD